jgi:hypothetical protein
MVTGRPPSNVEEKRSFKSGNVPKLEFGNEIVQSKDNEEFLPTKHAKCAKEWIRQQSIL